ncbi:MAG: AsmA family protein [Candidatus Omnitrophica bacterium]|nr:AsmA family protein [Candidatus Omnitrophota bacterium]
MRKKNKVLIIVFLFILLSGIVTVYLNKIVLPTKIKSLVIDNIAQVTRNKVTLDSLQFNLFKGIIFKNLDIYDGEVPVIKIEEARCSFFIIPIFKKQLVIPSIRFKSPRIILIHKENHTFNLQSLFSPDAVKNKNPGFKVIVTRIVVTDASIHFQDQALAEPFEKDIEGLNLNLHLGLPADVKFSLNARLATHNLPPTQAKLAGSFYIPNHQLKARILLQNLAVQDFAPYYRKLGINITEGITDARMDLGLADGLVSLTLATQSKALGLTQQDMQAKLGLEVEADIKYNLKDKLVSYSGTANITGGAVEGLAFINELKDINGQLAFNQSGVTTENLKINILGLPAQVKGSLTDFTDPLLKANLTSSLDMSVLQAMAKERFNFSPGAQMQGTGNLNLDLQAKILPALGLRVSGYLDVVDSKVTPDKGLSAIENINGRLEFTQSQLKWQGLNLKYLGLPYQASGTLTNFTNPNVQLSLSGPELNLDCAFLVTNGLFNFSKFSGKFGASDFSLQGTLDTARQPDLAANIKGSLNVDLADMKKFMPQFKEVLDKTSLQGVVAGQFSLRGNLNDFKSCLAQADLSAPSLSAWGLKGQDLTVELSQSAGILDIPSAQLSFYEGLINASFSTNLNTPGQPYQSSIQAQGIKIEKLKNDTPFKKEDISGAIQAEARLNGSLNDPDRLSGSGKIIITDGKLWQLDLFKGLGAILFVKDFANIIFEEASCSFLVQDKYVSTQDLQFKSNIANLSGTAKVGFDSTIDAALNVQVLDEGAPLTGTFRDITTAIVGQAGRFGVIRITGTLGAPKYNFQTAVLDLFKGLKGAIFGR